MTSIFYTVGLPGSGKSTYCKLIAGDDWTVVSTDAIRKELYGDESIQGDGDTVFETAHERMRMALRRGHNVIFDATNLYRSSRASIREYKALGYETGALVFDVPFETCMLRNIHRERTVPEDVMVRMAERMSIPTEAEGFDHITYAGSGD